MRNFFLTTDRLVLREFIESDWQAVHEYASDPEVVRYLTWGPNTEKDSRGFIQRAISYQQENPPRNHEFAVILKKENRLIGSFGLHVSNPEYREGWIGYCFNRYFWGKGYATETARAVLEYGFCHLKLHRTFATCNPENTASARVLEKIGMQQEGYLRENLLIKGRWRDSLLYAILENEWEAL